LRLSLSGRGSHVERCTAFAQVSSGVKDDQEPTGRSEKKPSRGGASLETRAEGCGDADSAFDGFLADELSPTAPSTVSAPVLAAE